MNGEVRGGGNGGIELNVGLFALVAVPTTITALF